MPQCLLFYLSAKQLLGRQIELFKIFKVYFCTALCMKFYFHNETLKHTVIILAQYIGIWVLITTQKSLKTANAVAMLHYLHMYLHFKSTYPGLKKTHGQSMMNSLANVFLFRGYQSVANEFCFSHIGA